MNLAIIILLSYSIIPTYLCKFGFLDSVTQINAKNKIALTFDDGPDCKYTESVLDILKQNRIEATFFVVARSADKYPYIIDRMIKEGHSVGLHSLEHGNSLYRGYSYTKKDFKESIEIMKRNNWPVEYYRPPWGHVNIFNLLFVRKYRLKIIMWNVIVGDWSSKITVNEIKNRVLNQADEGSIICLHDARGRMEAPSRTIDALRFIIPALKEKYDLISLNDSVV